MVMGISSSMGAVCFPPINLRTIPVCFYSLGSGVMEKVKGMEKVVVGIPVHAGTPLNFMQALSILFIGLRLGTDRLNDWTWVEVLAPLWFPFMLTWFIKLVIMSLGIGKDTEE